MNVANLLLRAGRASADRPAVVVGSDNAFADYRTLLGQVAALAGGLQRTFALTPGDRVALIMRNCACYIESLFACWYGGWVAVPVNAKLHPREFAFILAHSGARLCLASDELAGHIEAIRPELPDLSAVMAVGSEEYRRLITADPAPIARRAPEDTAWLFYTSGTTGQPKGAMLSHRNLMAMTTSYFVDVDAIATQDCIIHAAPMSHGSGMYILPHVAAAGDSREQRLRAGRTFRADRGAPRRVLLRRAHHRPPARRKPRSRGCRYAKPEDHRLRRRADTRRTASGRWPCWATNLRRSTARARAR